jgi:hypothetical protein
MDGPNTDHKKDVEPSTYEGFQDYKRDLYGESPLGVPFFKFICTLSLTKR